MKIYQIPFLLAIVLLNNCAVEEKKSPADSVKTDSLPVAIVPEQDTVSITDTAIVLVPPPPVFPYPEPYPEPDPCPDCPPSHPYPEPYPEPTGDYADLPDTVIAEEEILAFADHPAEFPGGDSAMRNFISKNIRYPEYAREMGIEGRAYISFVVEKDGTITNVTVARSAHAILDKEAIRVVRSMPNWTPASNNGKLVRVRTILPVKFSLM